MNLGKLNICLNWTNFKLLKALVHDRLDMQFMIPAEKLGVFLSWSLFANPQFPDDITVEEYHNDFF